MTWYHVYFFTLFRNSNYSVFCTSHVYSYVRLLKT